MSKHIKEIAKQMFEFNDNEVAKVDMIDICRFADYVDSQAIARELEDCAVLVEGGNHVHPKAPDALWAKTIAKLIRARGNHDTKR